MSDAESKGVPNLPGPLPEEVGIGKPVGAREGKRDLPRRACCPTQDVRPRRP